MATWPASLPAPLTSGYGVDPVDQTVSTDMEAGAERVRRRTVARNDEVDASWRFTDAQMAVFRAWFDDETLGVSGGASWFTVNLPRGDGGVRSCEARIKGGFKSKLLPGLCWSVTAKLKLRGGDLTAVQRLARILGLVVDGVYPSLVLAFSDTKALDSRITFTRSTTATYYDANGVMQTAAVNAARFDHDPVTGESLGLLIEMARTNLLTKSQQMDLWNSNGLTVTADAMTAPDGTLTAETTSSGGAGTTRYTTVTVEAGVTYTYSLCVKPTDPNGTVRVYVDGAAGTRWVDITIATGAVVGGLSYVSAGSEELADGWYRVHMVYVAGASGNQSCHVYPNTLTALTGWWGAQLEAGTFPTSYIPTTTAAVTRAADAASMTGTNFSSWYNASEGTLFADFITGTDPSGLTAALSIDNGAITSNSLSLRTYAAAEVDFLVYASGAPQFDSSGQTSVENTRYKSTGAYKLNDGAACVNAGGVNTDSSMTVPVAVNQAKIGGYVSGYLNGHIKRLVYYPARLTNAQLQALTA